LDVAGRRILSRDLSPLGRGDHDVQLVAHGEALPGRYWIRLIHPSGTRSRGITLLR